jgi:hypothetical protein
VLAVGKVLKSIAVAAVLVGISMIPGIGAPLAAALQAAAVATVLAGVSQQLFSPKMPKSQIGRLNVTLDPSTPRKAVFGTTAMALDLRYHESSGTDQEYVDYIIAVAAHKIASINEIWFEEKLAWSSAGGVAATYSGYLTNVDIVTEGNASNYISINGGSKWGASRRLTGCAYVHLRIKRTGNDKKQDSPLVNGLPSRVTIIGDGALLYDPRKDSTVPGGSGSHRANDQSTWGAYTNADDTDNPALQLLWWLLGWEINNKLSIGCGVPYTRIDMASFITAANICDENVTLAIGGTQKRYRTSGTASDGDDRMEIINNLLASMSGTIRDNSGKLMLTVMKNDLADYVLTLDENDMIGGFEWQQTGGLTENNNVARGRYVDPSQNSLYQFVDYPEVGFASPDGIDRVMSLDLFYVEDGRRAQRIAKQALQRNQYRGLFSTTFNAKALGCQVGDIVRINLTALGWANKPFRVVSQEIRFDGQVPLTLLEENAAIYAWDSNESAPLTATAPTIYNPLNNPLILAITDAEAVLDGKITSFYQSTTPTADGIGDIWFDTDDGNKMYRWNGTSWAVAQDTEITTAINAASDAQATADGKVKTFFQTSAPTAEAIGDLWMDLDDKNKMYRWSGSAWVSVRDAGKVTTFYATSAPTAEAIGDLWYNITTLVLSRWDGSAWVTTATNGAPSGTTVAGLAASTVAGTIKTDGVVNTDKVNTASVQTNSINAIATAYSTGSVSTTTSGATLAIQTVSITSTGNTILVNSSSIIRAQVSSGSLPIAVRVLIWVSWVDNLGNTGTLVNNVQPTFVHTTNVQTDMMVSIPAVHASTVSGRTYTYTMNAQYSSASIVGISGLDNRIMTAQEVKR